MYCPECSVEYRGGFYQCSDCNVSLVQELPESAPRDVEAPADHVIIFESPVPGEADMVAGALEEIGIASSVRRSIAGGIQLGMLDGGVTPGQRYALLVPRVAEARARELLSQLRPPEPDLDLSASDSVAPAPPVPIAPQGTRVFARILLALILVPLAYGAYLVLTALLASMLQ